MRPVHEGDVLRAEVQTRGRTHSSGFIEDGRLLGHDTQTATRSRPLCLYRIGEESGPIGLQGPVNTVQVNQLDVSNTGFSLSVS